MNRRLIIQFILGLLCSFAAGAASADNLSIKQRILMPGPVISGHAEFEAQCNKCHESFNKAGLTSLCLDCHDEIRADRQKKEGFHGLNPLSSTQSCNTCHADHIGRDADIINMQVDAFDHTHTRFPLEGKHLTQQCTACHEPEKKYREAGTLCIDCHKKDDFHRGALGEQCDSCHQPQSWQKRLEFDHADTGFPLEGLHSKVACSSCHAGQVYEFAQTTCVTCHQAADIHAGKNGQQCDTCHSVDGWKKTIFDHNTTDFPLRDKHAQVPCRACHSDGIVAKQTPTACSSCHMSDDIHQGRNGKQCDSCHRTDSWAKVKFDHGSKTGFPLTGAHQKVACTSCHTGSLTDNISRDCATCHAADDVHKDPEMKICATCHVTDNWRTVSRFDHDFTAFPLVGMHQIVACDSCHVEGQYIGTFGECVICHRADDHHKESLGKACGSCHTPNGWNLWQFDHEKETGFRLQGAHKNLACDGCHKPGTEPGSTSSLCGDCHQRQDIHNGSFGSNCGRCHSQSRFFELILRK